MVVGSGGVDDNDDDEGGVLSNHLVQHYYQFKIKYDVCFERSNWIKRCITSFGQSLCGKYC